MNSIGATLMIRERLTRAHDASLPVRMVVTFPDGGKTGKGGSYHVRSDLTGKIVEFDGDRFVIDFTRPQWRLRRSQAVASSAAQWGGAHAAMIVK